VCCFRFAFDKKILFLDFNFDKNSFSKMIRIHSANYKFEIRFKFAHDFQTGIFEEIREDN